VSQVTITSKVSTEVGEAAKTEIKSISFDDEEAISQLEELQQTYPGAEIYLNGELTVDFPEDVKIAVEPNQMVTAELVGSSLKLNYCGLEKAITFLKEQYAVESLEVRIERY
jgi:inner membrane protein